VTPLNRQEKRMLWWLTARLPDGRDVDAEALKEACEKTGLPLQRGLEIQAQYPRDWSRMLEKRACRLTGKPNPRATPARVSAALMTNLRCRHPQMWKKVQGLP
jgi:hypothetical protein